jgi:hypothetical protein
VNFDDAKKKISGKSSVTLVNVIDIEKQKVLWDKFVDIPKDVDLSKFDSEPVANAAFADLPGPALKSSTYTSIKQGLRGLGVCQSQRSKSSTARCWRPIRTPARSRTSSKHASRKRRARNAMPPSKNCARKPRRRSSPSKPRPPKPNSKVETQKVAGQQRQAQHRRADRQQPPGRVHGPQIQHPQNQHHQQRQPRHARVLGGEGRRSRARTVKADMAELESRLADETQKIRDQYDPAALTLETVKLTPVKKNIQVTATGILWLAK